MNILILTSIYPHTDGISSEGVTPVVHYFAKEWVDMGHTVYVINNCNKYPPIVYALPKKILDIVNSKLGIVFPEKSQGCDLVNYIDGVKVARFPMLKTLPHKRFSDRQLDRQFKKILSYLSRNNFVPDLIAGHWENPQIPLLSKLKNKYRCRTSLVFHGIVYLNQISYRKWAERYIQDIDVVGARSSTIAKRVKSLINIPKEPFICHSGIPDAYIDNNNRRETRLNNSYLYVGRLIKRKNIDISIKALKDAYGENNFTYNIVGVGDERSKLERTIALLELENNVHLLGFLPRDIVIETMGRSEVFIMISDDETFGLVYLEAMSKGCIVVASINGGADGVIKDGYNGFLCEQGSLKGLVKIIKYINVLTKEERFEISQRAVETASSFKDSKIARNYLKYVMG